MHERKGRPLTHLAIFHPLQSDGSGETVAERIPLFERDGKRRKLDIHTTGKRGRTLFKIALLGGDEDEDLALLLVFGKRGTTAHSFYVGSDYERA